MGGTRVTLVNKWSSVDSVTTNKKNDIKVTISHSGSTYSSSKTLSEIQSALTAGGQVRFISDLGAEGELVGNISGTSVSFFCLDNSGTSPVICIYTITSSSVTKSTSGSSEVFAVNFGYSSSPTCDKSHSEISSAFSSGKIIRPLYGDLQGIVVLVDMVSAVFYFIDDTGGTATWYIFTIDDQNSVTLTERVIGDALEPTVVTDSSSSPSSFFAYGNMIYKFTASSVTSLTITGFTPNGDILIQFNSGSTATTLTVPSSLKMPDGFTAPEANKHYEISIHDGYALVGSWPIS